MSSWFSEMAGKAEHFLNKMDQTAAAALAGSLLEKASDSVSSEATAIIPHLVTYQPRYTPTPVSAPLTSHSRNSSIGSSFSTVSSRDVHSNGNVVHPTSFQSSSSLTNSRGRDQDEKIFEFLNSKSPPPSKPSSSTARSPHRSDEEQSTASIEVVSASSDDGHAGTSGKGSPVVSEGRSEEMTETDSGTQLQNEDAGIDRIEISDLTANPAGDVIASLEKEISSLTRRNVAAETEVKRLSKRLENWQNQLTSSDASLRELQAREQDLKSAIHVRDESISILKVRLQECDELLKAKTESLDSLRLQYDLLSEENSRAQANLDQDIVSLQTRIQELQEELLTGTEALQKTQSESMMQIGMLEESNRALIDEMGSVQRELRSENSMRKEYEKQLKQLKGSFDSLAAELADYKSKAVKTLQSKDELIRSLQRKSNEGDEGIADTNDFQVDFEESNKQTLILQSQCDSLVQEVQELGARNESLKAEVDRLKNKEIEEMSARISNLSDELDEERRSKVDIENELRQAQDEIRYSRDDCERIKASLQSRIEDRDREVEQLRKQLVTKRSTTTETSLQELDQRCRGLTQSLIQKQTLIEQLSSERHSLALQLERSDARLRNALEESSYRSQMSSPSVSIGMAHQSPSHSSLVNRSGYRALEEDPVDGQVAMRVKRVYSQFNTFSIRLGHFLRVYPSARVFILVYILFLHVWVFIVLFSYRPEMHELDP